MTFLTLLSFTCVDVDDDNPEYLESILLGIGESVDLTGTWALTWDWYCDGEDVGSGVYEFYADGTTNIDAVWSAYTGTANLTTDGLCTAVNYSYNAQFTFDSTGTIYYLMVDGDEAGGPIDSQGDGDNDGESEMIRAGSESTGDLGVQDVSTTPSQFFEGDHIKIHFSIYAESFINSSSITATYYITPTTSSYSGGISLGTEGFPSIIPAGTSDWVESSVYIPYQFNSGYHYLWVVIDYNDGNLDNNYSYSQVYIY